jgi:hypothetical protein
MKTFLLIFFIFNICYIFSQNNYISYHKLIYYAEGKILEEKYSDALNIYDSAFVIYEKNFSKDIYNAAICAAIIDDKIKSKRYLFELSNYGIRYIHIIHIGIFRKALKNSFFSFYLDYRKNRKKEINNFSFSNRKHFLDSLEILDREFRIKKGSYKIFSDTIKKIDSINIRLLKNYLLKNEFPNEKQYKIQYPNELYNPWVILRHYYTHKIKDDTLSNILYSNVINGNLHINTYYSFLDQKQKKNITQELGNTLIFKYNDILYEIDYSKKLIDQINQNRLNVGLDSYFDYRKKLLYDKYPFIFNNIFGVISIPELFNNLIKIHE